jgi:hypothetical protein
MKTYKILMNSTFGRTGDTITLADSTEVVQLLERGLIGNIEIKKPVEKVKKQTYKPNEKKA